MAGGGKLAPGAIAEGQADKLVDTQLLVDRRKISALHNFELPVSLIGLGNIKGPGGVHTSFMLAYMGRKGRLEASCGVQVSKPSLPYIHDCHLQGSARLELLEMCRTCQQNFLVPSAFKSHEWYSGGSINSEM